MIKENALFRAESLEFVTKTQKLQSEFLNLITGTFQPSKQFYFQVGEQLSLRSETGPKISLNFDEPSSNYFRKGLGKKDLLLKAIGYGKGVRSVLDLTAGMLEDTVHFLSVGLKVTALERNPYIYFLIKKSVEASQRKELFLNLELIHSEAMDYLNVIKAGESVIHDAIYFDPMFPAKKKSALPKQEMVLFHQIVGADLDFEKVFIKAFEKKKLRLVVKRHLSHLPFGTGLRHSFVGKAVRYDYY